MKPQGGVGSRSYHIRCEDRKISAWRNKIEKAFSGYILRLPTRVSRHSNCLRKLNKLLNDVLQFKGESIFDLRFSFSRFLFQGFAHAGRWLGGFLLFVLCFSQCLCVCWLAGFWLLVCRLFFLKALIAEAGGVICGAQKCHAVGLVPAVSPLRPVLVWQYGLEGHAAKVPTLPDPFRA